MISVILLVLHIRMNTMAQVDIAFRQRIADHYHLDLIWTERANLTLLDIEIWCIQMYFEDKVSRGDYDEATLNRL